MIETVAKNRKYFSDRAYKKALDARKFYHIIGIPSVKNFKAIIKKFNEKLSCHSEEH